MKNKENKVIKEKSKSDKTTNNPLLKVLRGET